MPFNLNSNVMFYGPTSSGKSSILAAFQYVMTKTPPLMEHSQGKMFITLKTGTDLDEKSLKPVSLARCDLKNIGPTQGFMDEHTFFSFHRTPKDRKDALSAAQHTGILRSPPGKDFIQTIVSQLGQRDKDEAVDKTIKELVDHNLGESNTIIVVLDGDSVKVTENVEYSKFLDPLRILPGEINGIPRHFAFCVTKVDKHPQLRMLCQDEILIKYGISTLFNDLERAGAQAKVFTISPWGFLRDDITSNTKEEKSYPAGLDYVDPNAFKPYRIHEPFFWAFEGVERAKMRITGENRSRFHKFLYPTESALRDYISYEK